MIWGWLALVLFATVAFVVVWLAIDIQLERRQERRQARKAGRRRTAEERLAQTQERNERRRRLGLPDNDKAQTPGEAVTPAPAPPHRGGRKGT